jgi:hypothetical protein
MVTLERVANRDRARRGGTRVRRSLPGAMLAMAGLLPATPSLELAPAPTTARSVVARPVIALVARDAPGGAALAAVPTRSPWAGGRVRLLVLAAADDARGQRWLQVRLLRRPNGTAGWIPRDRVQLLANPWRVEVDRTRGTLRVLVAGTVIRRLEGVRVGAAATPTPAGLFAVAETFATDQPGVAPVAIALTAFSDVLETFAGGPGLVAIHGGSSPGPSNGCVVVAPSEARWLAAVLPVGTPVIVR